MEPFIAAVAASALFVAGTWLQDRFSKGRRWNSLWFAFSTTFAALLFLVAGSVGFRLDRHTVLVSGTRWSDAVIWWEIAWGAMFAVAVIFWRLAIRETDARLKQASRVGAVVPL